jgi:BirA family transcriptional regulator, biotin operon repressor / biotin---[acetyl-CoA-carboxylase] ligase
VSNRHKLLAPASVEPLLRGRFGRPYLWSESCPSTQDALRDPSLPEGAVAVTEHQTAGRGRAGRQWEDEAGEAAAPQLSLVCALAVAEAVEAAAAVEAEVKWPNDVVAGGKKLAGILLEGHERAVVCGIGVNVNQTEASLPAGTRSPVASLRTLTGRNHDRAALLGELLARLESLYAAWLADGLTPLARDLAGRDGLHGHAVQIGGVAGVADGLAHDGRLRVRRPDGTTALVASGEVEAPG